MEETETAMYLLPQPKEMMLEEGIFQLDPSVEIHLHHCCNQGNYEGAKLLRDEIERTSGLKLEIGKTFHKKARSIFLSIKDDPAQKNSLECYRIRISPDILEIEGTGDAGLLYGIQTLRQILRQQGRVLPCLTIRDWPDFDNRGFYLDVTRGRVPTIKALKELADRLSFYKINQLQLYIEHTFAFKGLSEAWGGKDPLTAEEILELDAYCRGRHIELVPSLSTFGHFYEILRTNSYQHLCEFEGSAEKPYSWVDRMAHHTLDVSNEGSLELVREMLQQYIPLFTSKQFNICCDETFDLGKGKNRELAAKVGTGRLYVDFLSKIISIVKGFGKEVMMWSDIILKHPDLMEEIPDDIIFLNWAYEADVTEKDTKTIALAGKKQYVCPGTSGWSRLMSDLDNAFQNIRRMVDFGWKYGAIGVLNTDWGDYGHINHPAGSVPAMAYGASLSWTPSDQRAFGEIDEAVSALEFGVGQKSIVPLMRELSRLDMKQWSHFVWMKEVGVSDHPRLPELVASLDGLDEDEILAAGKKAWELEREIGKVAVGVDAYNMSARQDIEEILSATRGIALMNAAFLQVKRLRNGSEKAVMIQDNAQQKAFGPYCNSDLPEGTTLAAELLNWFSRYSELWRRRNKDSELYRIREVVEYICRQLR